MIPRYAAHDVDKVGGITHILTPDKIPIYIRGDSDPSSAAKNAWDRLIPVMHEDNRADLQFHYPARGDGKYAWCPSWDQVNKVNCALPPAPTFILQSVVSYCEEQDLYECWAWLIEDCTIQGIAKPDPDGRCRAGTLRLVHDGAEHSFTVTAHHQEPIPDGAYVLIGVRSYILMWPPGDDVVVWAVGTFSFDKRFEKLSVLRTERQDDIDKMFHLGLIGAYNRRKREWEGPNKVWIPLL
ncbi:hypothetical protein EIP86_009431 [Pleurotus ostreatoroseus]|nr:hypothetical protein EIP86_009431 [Pleurotus ostreatoroseus]